MCNYMTLRIVGELEGGRGKTTSPLIANGAKLTDAQKGQQGIPSSKSYSSGDHHGYTRSKNPFGIVSLKGVPITS